MKDMLDNFYTANPWDGLDWDRESVTFVWEDVPGNGNRAHDYHCRRRSRR